MSASVAPVGAWRVGHGLDEAGAVGSPWRSRLRCAAIGRRRRTMTSMPCRPSLVAGPPGSLVRLQGRPDIAGHPLLCLADPLSLGELHRPADRRLGDRAGAVRRAAGGGLAGHRLGPWHHRHRPQMRAVEAARPAASASPASTRRSRGATSSSRPTIPVSASVRPIRFSSARARGGPSSIRSAPFRRCPRRMPVAGRRCSATRKAAMRCSGPTRSRRIMRRSST